MKSACFLQRTKGLAFALVLLSTDLAFAQTWHRVAYDRAGVADGGPHEVEGGTWRFANPGTADEAVRTAHFGDPVKFAYTGLKPAAAYKVKLRFFSDAPREMRVTTGTTELLKSVGVGKGIVVERAIAIPAAAYASGELSLTVERIKGPNAVVSDVEVLSSDPSPLGAIPPPSLAMPRLSPRPVEVSGVSTAAVDLAGLWQFNPGPPPGFETANDKPGTGWADIQVPGEWVMQGFKVAPGKAAGYRRTFNIPGDWNGNRIKLRCDGIYSGATVFINGKEAGRHIGGFTPFELDVTTLVKPGSENTISVAVLNEALADKLASGSQYASHPLGGISRKIRLMALPEVNLSALRLATKFDQAFRNATLEIEAEATNEGTASLKDLHVALRLKAPDGKPVPLSPDRVALEALKGRVSIPVAAPLKWDNEHPRLYELTATLEAGDRVLETVKQRIGFRQVEVRGNQMFVNNVPVKLHGVCRHEVHPLRGRSLTPELWRKDAELFREGNCNFIRTSHYPPAEEFIEACDELGMFVEVEAPFCWADNTALTKSQIPELMTRQELEMLEFYRNYPSVTHWSLGNESRNWGTYFLPTAKLLRQLDQTRPLNFSQFSPTGDAGFCDIGNHHYPGLSGPDKYAAAPRPITFDEYCHLNSYNRRELATDPGLRDLWGQGLELMWEKMRKSQGCLGGSIWAAIDDTFFLPGGETVGYGTWGPIDGWRRPKPEFWHMKKVYSPLRLLTPNVSAGQPVRLTVENRHDFTDLKELRFEWNLGGQSGVVKTSAAPGASGTLEIPGRGDGELLELRAIGPRGFVEDVWNVPLGADPRIAPPVPTNQSAPVKLEKTAGAFVICGLRFTATVNAKTGLIQATGGNGKPSMLTGPELLLLPLNGDNCGGVQMSGSEKDVAAFTDACHDWKAASVTAQETDSGVEVRMEGAYSEAKGTYRLSFGNDGIVTVKYAFTVIEKGKCDPRQIGLVFGLPADCQTLSWRRKAHWSAYPPDHIGRPQGVATAFVSGAPLSGLAGPRVQPNWSWSVDGNKYGTNDFRSTKMNILEASLYSAGGNGVRVLSDGSQHVRSWLDGAAVRLLVADYTNEGAPPFFSEHVTPHRPLNPGATVEGIVRLELR